MADPQFCVLAIDSWATCYSKAEWASWIQAVAASFALFASYRLARRSHLDAIERDQLAIQRAERARAEERQIAIQHWVGLLRRACEALTDVQSVCKGGRGDSGYFRSALANMRVLAGLMERRAMDILVEYEVLKHVTAGIAAINGTVSHLEALIRLADTLPASRAHFLSHVEGIPGQMEVCIAELRKLLDGVDQGSPQDVTPPAERSVA